MRVFYYQIKSASIGILLALFFLSCYNNKNREHEKILKAIVEENLGKKLLLPDSLIVYSPFSNYLKDSLEISTSNLKIYSYINASCATCVESMNSWIKLIHVFSKYQVPVIIICDSKDNFELIKYLHESDAIKSFPYPLFFDVGKNFLKRNKFMEQSLHFETVLTDKNNTILLIGNPIYSKGIEEMYIKEIEKRL